MRALPVDLTAIRAAAELLVIVGRTLRQLVKDFVLRHRHEFAIAAHTEPERLNGALQVEPLDNLGSLLARVGGTRTIAVRDDAALQQSAIAGQENPAFVG